MIDYVENVKKMTDDQIRVLEKGNLDCEDIEDVMGDYVDGELHLTVRDRVAAHISGCAQCQEFYDSYLFTIRAASLVGDVDMPKEVSSRLRKALNSRLGISLPNSEGDEDKKRS